MNEVASTIHPSVQSERRRRLMLALIGSAVGGGFTGASAPVVASTFWHKPRTLWLVRPQTGEEIKTTYWTGSTLEWDGYLKLCRILRDPHAGSAVTIDVAVFDVLRGVTGYQEERGKNEPIIVTNGYTTIATNERLQVTHGAAKGSRHKEGKAVDCRSRVVDELTLAKLAVHFGAGGVGLYPERHFVHLDSGPTRRWISRKVIV